MGKPLANLIAVTLRHGTYETKDATHEGEAASLVRDWKPDLAIVDIDHYASFLTSLGGGIAQGRVPLLAFTRRRDAAIKLRAYEAGADDIIEMPFTLDEIIARPFALLRRAKHVSVPLEPKIRLNGHLQVDLLDGTVKLDGAKSLELTPIQQTLLYLLAANQGDILTRETLLGLIWGSDLQIESNVVDRHIRELRVKLADDWRTPQYIETVPGRGYRFKSAPALDDAAK
jgi:two-component system, OmpR family, alkaline phosphatase synthesis response regulator PhoP